jgi:hypothetical protein
MGFFQCRPKESRKLTLETADYRPLTPDHQPLIEGAFMFDGLFEPLHLMAIAGIVLLVSGPRKPAELGKGPRRRYPRLQSSHGGKR